MKASETESSGANKPPGDAVVRKPFELTPRQFEAMVKRWFEATGYNLDAFEARLLDRLSGVDGEYSIDVTLRFTAFGGAQFLVLVECKRHKHPIKRSVVEVLRSRLRSTGAHKGFVVATAPFQAGARAYAERHGIALVEIVEGEFAFVQLLANRRTSKMPADYPSLVGLCMYPARGIGTVPLIISERDSYCLRQLLDDIVDDEQDAQHLGGADG